jgi:type IV pilus assembly protein PilQ
MTQPRTTASTFVPAVALLALAGLATPIASAQQGLSVKSAGNVRLASAPTTEASAEAQASPDGPRVSVSDQNMVELHVKNEDIAGVLQLLGSASKKNIIVTKNVSGKVSADLYSASFYEALDAILHPNGFAYVEKGNFIYVYTIEELERIEKTLKRRVAKKITLNYLNGPDAAEFVKGMLSKEGEIKTTPKIEAFAIASNSPVGKDDFALAASIVVTDYEENLAAIEALLRELDTKPQQVLIEATVLQTKLTEKNAFGVDISILDDINFSDFAQLTAGPRAAADALIRGGPSAGTGFVPTDNRGIAIGSTPGGTSGPGTFKFGLISSNVGAFVRLLDEVSDTTVLANPKVLTLNRQPSRVLVGRRVAYLSTTATETSTTQTVEYLDTGVQLRVRPFVSSSGDIRLEINPSVSSAEPQELLAAGGGRVTVPDEVTQEVTTNIIVPDSMTVVIGGLFTETTTVGRSQVPGLGDLPIIGSAFKGTDNNLSRDEIIFLVTPSIVSDKSLLDQGEQANAMGDRLRAGARQSLLPFSRERMTSQLNIEAENAAREGKFDQALWKINRSLSMKPNQEQALRLRDRILGQRETWPTNSTLDGVVGDKVRDKMRSINPPAQMPRYRVPWNHAPLPMTPFNNDQKNASAPTTITPVVVPPADLATAGDQQPLFTPVTPFVMDPSQASLQPQAVQLYLSGSEFQSPQSTSSPQHMPGWEKVAPLFDEPQTTLAPGTNPSPSPTAAAGKLVLPKFNFPIDAGLTPPVQNAATGTLKNNQQQYAQQYAAPTATLAATGTNATAAQLQGGVRLVDSGTVTAAAPIHTDLTSIIASLPSVNFGSGPINVVTPTTPTTPTNPATAAKPAEPAPQIQTTTVDPASQGEPASNP